MNIRRVCQFLLDKESGKMDAKLRYRIKWNRNKYIVSRSIGYRVDIDKWSKETQRCKNNTTHGKKKTPASVINREIERFQNAADTVFAVFEKQNKMPTADEFRVAFEETINPDRVAHNKGNFYDVYDEFIKTMGAQNAWQKATYTKFGAIKMHLKSFDSALSFDKITDEWMQRFVQYQINVPLRNTTISKNTGFLKWFMRWAHKKGYYDGKVHDTFRHKLKGTDGNNKEVIHLSWDELLGLYDLKIPDTAQRLARVRDIFCFCCFTSLRYSDVAKLRRSDIKETHISVVTQKTADGLKIELNDYSREILEKYKNCTFMDDKALPIISNQRMNDNLKELGKLAGLNEQQRIVYFIGGERYEEVYPKYELLTTHCGRRTFIVNALYLGIPAEVVMKWTGHSDYKSMKPYVKIVDDLKAREMCKFNKKSLISESGTKNGLVQRLLTSFNE